MALLACGLRLAGALFPPFAACGAAGRYLVFLTPLACLAAGLALARLAERGSWGPWLAWALAAALALQGAALWLGGIFGPIAPSMVPLLR